MSPTEISLQGTLKADGTLELDMKPALAPGRVTIVLRRAAEAAPPNDNWFQVLQRIRARREAEGYPFMNETETNQHIEWLRQADRIDELLGDVNEHPRNSGRP